MKRARATLADRCFTRPSGLFTIAERWNGSAWRIQPTPNLPGIHDLDPFFVSCPTPSTCTAVGGYTNGLKLTLAERWQGSGGKRQPAANLHQQDTTTQARANQR